jgi:hypothetical protein
MNHHLDSKWLKDDITLKNSMHISLLGDLIDSIIINLLFK